MGVIVEMSQLEALVELMHRRATDMVPNAIAEGEHRADDYAAAGGRHRNDPRRRYPATLRRLTRVRRATAAQKARMIERVLYRNLHDFWGSW
jgi:hypothetical protein